MKLRKLFIKNIRNIHEIALECDQGIHFIHGQNAQGKTSILESIYLLSNLRSFRDSDLSALLQNGKEYSSIKGNFLLDSRSENLTEAELRVDLVQGVRFEKKAYINQKLARSAVEYFGVKLQYSPIQFHAINLNPTSTDLIRGEPGFRRNYLNQVISSENTEYMSVLKRYQKLLDQKNALLKQENKTDKKPDLQLLRILNENLAKEGAILIFERLKYLQKLAPPIQDFLLDIAPKQQRVNLGYKSGETLYFTGHFELPTVKILEENLHQKMELLSTQERVRKSSLVGPHRDDLLFRLPSGMDLINVGSQGEIRSLLLALKLSELEEFKKTTGVQPVLLIDDFSSELDSTRRGFLLSYLKDSELQIFVTSTDDLSVSLEDKGKSIQILEGRIL